MSKENLTKLGFEPETSSSVLYDARVVKNQIKALQAGVGIKLINRGHFINLVRTSIA